MKEIEVGKEVKVLTERTKFTVVAINGDRVDCEYTDDEGVVNIVTLPKNMLAPASAGFLDLLS